MWCHKAKALMTNYGIIYTEEVFDTDERRAWFKENVAATFPQIYESDGTLIGGYMEFEAWLMQRMF
jgi:glutaredoxin